MGVMGVIATTLAMLVVLGVIAISAGRLAFPLPTVAGRAESQAIPASEDTDLGARMIGEMARHPGKSGFIPILSGYDALGSRLRLAEAAQSSIDAQYYIWHDDMSGFLLLKALLEAARRGVRVRLLLDDNGIRGLDRQLAALNMVENLEVRLFNPSMIRRPKLLGYIVDFVRINRRMHNKAFIVDGSAAIIGGRNIGNEYFSVGDADFYIDLDVLAVGPIVQETAAAFDLYWNCASAFPLAQIVKRPGNLDQLDACLDALANTVEAQTLVGALTTSFERFERATISPEWTAIRLMVDDPVKGQGLAQESQLMVTHLNRILGGVKSELNLISAYFVPGRQGAQLLAGLARKGRRVRILTNALNTTDVLLVHAGYTKYRRQLLRAGVELYELKLRAGKAPGEDELPRFLLSGASLHAKTFAIDKTQVFIGSFNFDPRSALLNCEMGFVIDSPALAEMTSNAFDGPLPVMSYQPVLTAENRMAWTEMKPDGSQVVYQSEPGATWAEQFAIALIQRLPVEWLL